jgi:hypothetical protein
MILNMSSIFQVYKINIVFLRTFARAVFKSQLPWKGLGQYYVCIFFVVKRVFLLLLIVGNPLSILDVS